MEMEYEASEGKAYKQASIGTHTGICYAVIDIGTQKTSFEGVEDEKRQVILGWELPEELTDEGKPLSVIKTYTLSFNEKATLAKDYKAWTKEATAKKFNLGKLIGLGCNLNIGATSGGKAKVTGVSALKASEQVPTLSRDSILYDLRAPSETEFAKLPDFIKDKIAQSPEFQNWVLKKDSPAAVRVKQDGSLVDAYGEELNDSVPF